MSGFSSEMRIGASVGGQAAVSEATTAIATRKAVHKKSFTAEEGPSASRL